MYVIYPLTRKKILAPNTIRQYTKCRRINGMLEQWDVGTIGNRTMMSGTVECR